MTIKIPGRKVVDRSARKPAKRESKLKREVSAARKRGMKAAAAKRAVAEADPLRQAADRAFGRKARGDG